MAADHPAQGPRQTTHPTPAVLAPIPVVQGQGHDRAPAISGARALPLRKRRIPLLIGTGHGMNGCLARGRTFTMVARLGRSEGKGKTSM